MLRFLRKYSSSTGIKILYGVLAALFVIWGVGAVGGERIDAVAHVHGETITRRDLDRTTANLQRRYEEMFRGQFSAEMARSLNLRGRALDQLIEQALIQHEAGRLGITVSEGELVDAITRLPELQDNGQFNRDRLETYLRYQRDRGEFEDELRRSIVFQRIQSLVEDGVQVTDAEVEDRYRMDHEQVTLAVARIGAAELAKSITASDDDLQRYLSEHEDRYRVPAQVRARYAAYRAQEFTDRVQPTDDEIAAWYDLHKAELFNEQEQVRARHILVKVDAGADDDTKAKARKKAEDLLAKVKAGGDFAALAKKNSDDTASAANGGDVGLFGRGRMTPEFQKAAFALDVGAVSDVVETPFGFHIIKVEEHRPGGLKPLDQVRDQVVDNVKHERALDLARNAAEEDRRKIARGTSFAEAVGAREVTETSPFSAGADVPGVGRVKEFVDAALALREGEVSDLVETHDAVYLLTPFARVEAHAPALADVRERVLADVQRERGEAAAKERGEKLLARAKEIGLDKAAAELGVPVEETDPFDRRTGSIPKLPGATDLKADAFALTTAAPLASKVYAAGGDTIVAALRTRTPADMAGFPAAKDALRESTLQQKRGSVMTAYIDYLKERATREGALEVRPDALGRG
ncbi:MAG TPA: SurA N-terminal domain-containing protein [Candidatus Binatia bacterium]|nr:SurA N-terminal domain-containing protein [Candidatus Binatia bacterium]